ncbi:MAG: hypothetical protein HY908_03310 [Myxococcales bacterium]|nr:hypothetical protein [Myxococcales bacterium]
MLPRSLHRLLGTSRALALASLTAGCERPQPTPPSGGTGSAPAASASLVTLSPPTPPPSASETSSVGPMEPRGPALDVLRGDEVPELGEAVRDLEANRYAAANAKLEQALRSLPGLEGRTLATLLLGRAAQRSRDTARARSAFERVLALWAGAKSEERQALTAPALGRVLMARGEAAYWLAEQKRAAVEALVPPKYHGSGKVKDIEAFVWGKFAAWSEARRAAIEVAQAEYIKVKQLDPEPPPRWLVAAAARVGDMWAAYVEVFRSAPMPQEWSQPGFIPGIDPPMEWREIAVAYKAALEEVLAPHRDVARKAYEACVAVADRAGVRAPDRDACARWLEAHPAPAP